MNQIERWAGRGARMACAVALFVALGAAGAGCGGGSSGDGGAPAAATTVPPELQGVNLVDFHDSFTESQNDLCMTCHGSMLDRTSLDPSYPEFHKRKLDPRSGILPGWKCTDCHKRVDLAARSGGNLRKQVDVEQICYPCHLKNGIATTTKLYVK